MLAVVEEVLTDEKVKTSVASAIKQVPLSDTSNIGRVDLTYENNLDMKCVCMLVTDGAPSMAGKVSGLAACWSIVMSQMITLHCIVLYCIAL